MWAVWAVDTGVCLRTEARCLPGTKAFLAAGHMGQSFQSRGDTWVQYLHHIVLARHVFLLPGGQD